MKKIKQKQLKKELRIKRVRAKIFGTKNRPRLCVLKSNKHIYAQIIDDEAGKTLVAASDKEIKSEILKSQINFKPKISKSKKETEAEGVEKEFLSKNLEISREIGKLIAKKAIEKGIKAVVFDRRGCKYHGIIKAAAEGARIGGLKL